MPRRQVFEFGDLPWVPTRFKHYLTDVLSISVTVGETIGDVFCLEPVLDEIIDILEQTGTDRIIDLCSGAAVPPTTLQRRLAARGVKTEVVLTDLRPNLAAFQHAAETTGCSYSAEPIDATDVPDKLIGLRTVFNAFHHFPPDLARSILTDTVAKQQGILIIEIPHRSLLGAMSMSAFSLLTLGLTPLIRPFSLDRILWTYLVPIVPMMIGVDGFMSSVRAYDTDELTALTGGLSADYTWRIYRARGKGMPLAATVLLGRPAPRDNNAGQPIDPPRST